MNLHLPINQPQPGLHQMHLVAGLREIHMIAIAALSVTGTKKFSLQKRLSHKGYPLYGTEPFLAGFCQRGHN